MRTVKPAILDKCVTDFGGQRELTVVGQVLDISSETTVVISAYEADPLIAASTRLGVIGGVAFKPNVPERVRYRSASFVKLRVTRVVDLEMLERQGKLPGANLKEAEPGSLWG
ncbi:BQ5605_C119g13278 [Microbotryum silenes-dioicae]|uniref:BQ5605_C101g13139 protein n=1 Tax=Microbotryum silenes-dioicae TaxID=796604 RepID=A0A2X0PHM6_9BASI|nr:BQ5605_C101g13139 [Microbotryum silenes-dioicae]SGZ30330.1 BQ5605_C118g13269 [Microbotryum silenes-dioicae]SGZ30364.1 BQ5605_C119g13278 [Microbotryum silenes-dioicae]